MDSVRKLSRSVKDRAVLITGAASGMGRATAHVFAQEGALVAVTDINESGVARVVDEIKSEGGKAHGWRLDVFDGGEIKRRVGASEKVGCRENRQYRVDRGSRRNSRRQPLRGSEDRSDRTHPGTGRRS